MTFNYSLEYQKKISSLEIFKLFTGLFCKQQQFRKHTLEVYEEKKPVEAKNVFIYLFGYIYTGYVQFSKM